MQKKNGELVNNKHDILKRWNEHFQELFEIKKSIGNNEEGILREKSEEEEDERKESLNSPSISEVEMAIDKLRNNRAPGPDNLQAEFIKFGKPILLNTLQLVMYKVWTTEKIPEDGNKS